MEDADTERDALRLRLAANLRRAREREGLSQPAAAERMREESFPYTQQTLARIEAGQRKVPGEELVTLARIYNVALDSLARPEGLALAGADLLSAARKVREAERRLRDIQRRYEVDREWLERLLARAEETGNAAKLTNEVRAARNALTNKQHGVPQEAPVVTCTFERSMMSAAEIPDETKAHIIRLHRADGHQHCEPLAPGEQPLPNRT